MAIATDAVSNGGANSTTATVAHTCTGSNLVLWTWCYISGGDSLLVNASNFLNSVKVEQKNLLKVPVIRDIITPGKEYSLENLLKNKFPILNEDGPFTIFRYMRYWIERGHQKADIPLSKEYIEVLNQFDNYLDQMFV